MLFGLFLSVLVLLFSGSAGRVEAFVVNQGAPQEKLNLRVETPQVVGCPALQRVQDFRIDSQQEWFSLGHGLLSLIKTAGVDDRLGFAFAA